LLATGSSLVCGDTAAAERPAQYRRQHLALIRLAHLFDAGVKRVTDLRVFEISRGEENLQFRAQPARRGRELRPMHSAGHEDVGEQKIDRRVLAQNLQSLGPAAGGRTREPRLAIKVAPDLR